MGHYYILSSNAGVPATGDSSFVWQCITFLLGTDLIYFVAVSLGILAFCIAVKAFITIMED